MRVEKCRCGGREKELMGRDASRGGCEKNHDEEEDHGEELVDHDEGE